MNKTQNLEEAQEVLFVAYGKKFSIERETLFLFGTQLVPIRTQATISLTVSEKVLKNLFDNSLREFVGL